MTEKRPARLVAVASPPRLSAADALLVSAFSPIARVLHESFVAFLLPDVIRPSEGGKGGYKRKPPELIHNSGGLKVREE